MRRDRLASLQALFDDDFDAFLVEASKRVFFEEWFPIFVNALRDDAERASRLRDVLPSHYQRDFDAWMTRRVLALDVLSLPDLLALATSVARETRPEFPSAEVTFETVSSGWCHSDRRADTRHDGIGWVLRFEEEDVGPAETIHRERFRAEAWASGVCVVVVGYRAEGSTACAFVEPADAPPLR